MTKFVENYCIDCGKRVSAKYVKRCQACYLQNHNPFDKKENKIKSSQRMKGKGNYCYKDGRTQNIICICGKKKSYRSKLCQSCAVKYLFRIGKLNTKKENNGNWKGGITSKSTLFYNSKKWKKTSSKILKRDNYKCLFCNKKSSGNLEVHHIISVKDIWNSDKKQYHLLYNQNNLITLCNKCHKILHNTLSNK